MPIIMTLVVPLIILDIWTEIYHRICFPICKIPYVKRRKYIKIDRHKLKYLNFVQKISCAYCGYANGLAAYWVRIGGETERYWCGIMHKKNKNFIAPDHHKDFTKYGDEKEFREKYKIEECNNK